MNQSPLNSQSSGLRYETYVKQIQGIYQQPIAKTSGALVLTLGTIAFFGFAAIRPTLATVSELVKEIEQKQEIDQKLSQKIAALTAVQEEYLSIQDRLYLLDTAIPADREKNLLLLQLEYLAWLNGVFVENLRIDPMIAYSKNPEPTPKITDSFPSYTAVLTVAAKDQLTHRTFLEDLSNLNRILRIESVSFSQQEEEEQDSPSLKMTVTLRAYWQGPPSTTPAQTTQTDSQESLE